MKQLSNWSQWVVAGALSLGCSADDDSDDFGSDGNACDHIDGLAYVSKEEKDCGIGPGGEAATCHWRIEFADGAFDWRYSDLILEGTYSCDGAEILGITPGSDMGIVGELEGGSGDLLWDGVMYELEM